MVCSGFSFSIKPYADSEAAAVHSHESFVVHRRQPHCTPFQKLERLLNSPSKAVLMLLMSLSNSHVH